MLWTVRFNFALFYYFSTCNPQASPDDGPSLFHSLMLLAGMVKKKDHGVYDHFELYTRASTRYEWLEQD